jgi:NADPH-dependent 7-cyano-7-deazaguanine reductase QueF
MEPSPKTKRLLERMAQIERMERGTLCQMTGRPHYNHQTWRNGRNEVRYVPADEAQALQQAIEGYRLFMALAEQYADEVIRLTRRERKKKKAPQKRKT